MKFEEADRIKWSWDRYPVSCCDGHGNEISAQHKSIGISCLPELIRFCRMAMQCGILNKRTSKNKNHFTH